jgi:cell pole-organizing protein PopZ
MANPNTAHEPSMEEILASIRQIISQDGEGPAPTRFEARKPSRPGSKPDGDTETRTSIEPALETAAAGASKEAPRLRPLENGSARPALQSVAAEPNVRPAHRPEVQMPAQSVQPTIPAKPAEEPPLLSERSDAAVAGAFTTLTKTMAQNSRTLDDLVTEMLRPMLKEWLDDNLPVLVERLVKEEIERVSRGRR